MENKPIWKHKTFVNFFKSSPRKAYEYRRDALWNEIPDEYKTDEEKGIKISIDEVIEMVEEKELEVDTVETIEPVEPIEFTKEDLQAKLKEAGINFSPNAGSETLLKRCIENNLV